MGEHLLVAVTGRLHYTTSEAGVIGFTRALARGWWS